MPPQDGRKQASNGFVFKQRLGKNKKNLGIMKHEQC